MNKNLIIMMFMLLSMHLHMTAQDLNVSGAVSDEDGQPVIGAAVSVRGTSSGTTTDNDGLFTLNISGDKAVVEISSLGYKTVTIAWNGQKFISATLENDMNYLDEVVVVGYGTTTRRHLISSVSTVGDNAIKDRPVANIQEALQGAAANLIIQNKGFDPNSPQTNISIRGVSTMGNNSPLVVIDGVPQQGAGRMNDLNPEDIASVSVLKDAGSSAIYGARSANGVILITTKSGKNNQKTTIKAGVQVGIENPHILQDPVPSYLNSMLRNEMLVNSGSKAIFTSSEIRDMYEHGDSEFALKQIMQNALQQTYNIQVSGGSANTTYMISGRYYDQESNYVGPGYGTKKYNIRSNISTKVGKLKLGLILGFTGVHNKSTVAQNIIANAQRIPTYWFRRFYDDEGNFYNLKYKYGTVNKSPYAELWGTGYNKNDNNYATGTFTAEYEIIKGLKARAVLNGEIRNSHRFTDNTTYMVTTDNGTEWNDPSTAVIGGDISTPASDWAAKSTYLSSQIVLDFNRTFAGKHNVSALAGYSQESNYDYEFKIKKTYLDDLNQPGEGTVIDVDGTSLSSENNSRSALQSFFGKAAYSYDERYYVEFTARYDQSSKFLKIRNGGFFPAVNLGWRISQEKFMENYRYKVGELKLRTSYGLNGNQYNVGLYDFITKYGIGENIYGFNDTAVPGLNYTMGNENVTWETAKTFNIGVDASFFKNSFSASFDWFYKRTSNILLNPIIPGSFGAAIGNENRGVMDNTGWELTINYNLTSGDWNHIFSFNIADSQNKVVKYGPREIISKGGEMFLLIEEGKPLNSYFGYQTDGIFQSYEEIQASATPKALKKEEIHPGDVKYKDRNHNGVIDEDDRTVLGYGYPRYTYGFSYNLSWKGIDFSIMLQGVLKRDYMLRGELVEPFQGDYGCTMYEHQMDFWRETNRDARWPRLTQQKTTSQVNNWKQGSDLNILNAAYLRVKNIQIGYTLPKKWTKTFGCESLRIYFNTQNPFTFSKWDFIDPETSEFGANMSAGGTNSLRNYPTLRYFGGGINLTF